QLTAALAGDHGAIISIAAELATSAAFNVNMGISSSIQWIEIRDRHLEHSEASSPWRIAAEKGQVGSLARLGIPCLQLCPLPTEVGLARLRSLIDLARSEREGARSGHQACH